MTTTSLATTSNSLPSAPLTARLRSKVKHYVDRERSAATLRVYRSAQNQFESWVKRNGFIPLPAAPEVIAAYIAELADAGAKISTIRVAVSAIRHFHLRQNFADPTHHVLVSSTISGVSHDKPTAPKKKDPIEAPLLGKMLNIIPNTLSGRRDRLMFRMMFMGAFRRSELVALNIEDVRIDAKEMHITIRRSKTDQTGQGFVKHIAVDDPLSHRLVEDYRAWLGEAKIAKGAIFRRMNRFEKVSDRRLSAQSVALLVKHYARKAGIDPRNLSGHSFRSGFVTSALKAGAHEGDIMDITAHKDARTVRGYNRDASVGARRAVKSALSQMNK